MRFRKQNTAELKFCPHCQTLKPRGEFYRNRAARDGFQAYCTVCDNQAKYRSMQKKPDYYRAMSRRHNKERRLRDPEAIKKEKRRDYERHRERYAQLRERWFAEHPDERRQQHVLDRHRRRAREAAAFIEDVEPVVVWARDNGTCYICGESVSFYAMHIDHVIPISKGGKHCYTNVKATHGDCNQWKHARIIPELVTGSTPSEKQCE